MTASRMFRFFRFLVRWRIVEEDNVEAVSEPDIVCPPENLSVLLDLVSFLKHHSEPGFLLGSDGERARLPEEVYRVLMRVVAAMHDGTAINVIPQARRLTTQEAADILGVSRRTLVKLLEQGKIPYEQPGRHRRILLSDLLNYRQQRRAERRATLDRLTEDASEAGLYEDSHDDYVAAVKAARKRIVGESSS